MNIYLRKGLKTIHSFYLEIRVIFWILFVNEYLFDLCILEGESMLPTFSAFGEIVLMEKISQRFNLLKKGDIICVLNPINPDMKLCKRILANENEVYKTTKYENLIKVPSNHIWVEGDNKDNSLDSRKFGPITKNLVQGKIIMRIWPLPLIGRVY
jgi:inner membrane protease subunit 1